MFVGDFCFVDMINNPIIYIYRLWKNKKTVLFILLTFLVVFSIYHTDGPHQKVSNNQNRKYMYAPIT